MYTGAHRYPIYLFIGTFILLLISCKPDAKKQDANILKVDCFLQSQEHIGNLMDNTQINDALQTIQVLNNDSLKMIYYNKIAYMLAEQPDTTFFYIASKRGLSIAERRKDSSAIADSNWNYGIHYLKRNLYNKSYAHYQQAHSFFHERNDYYAGKMLYNMAYIRSKIKDYTGSEILLFQAIPIFKKLNKNKQLYFCYNLLGTIYDELQEYDNALKHYEKALDFLNKVNDKYLYEQDIQNNIGLLYQKKGRQKQAIELFDKALSQKDLKKLDPALYARIIDNRAYSLYLLNENSRLPDEFLTALHIRDSIWHEPGILMSHIHLSSYFLKHQDTAIALQHAIQAYTLSKQLHLNRDALTALLLLAEIKPSKKENYLREHIKLTDSLNQEERKVRDKFTRIQFETDSYIEKNNQLTRDKILIVASGAALTIILILLIVNYKQRAKNKALEFETEQQKANEKIYLLTLKQQANLDKGRLQERRRISEELHDGILARLFGIRLNWEFLKLSGERKTLVKHREFLAALQQAEKEIRDISHDLRNELFLSETLFVRNVEHLIKKWGEQASFKFEFKTDESIIWENIDNYTKANIYKILEEALHNIAIHAEATLIKVYFNKTHNTIKISVEDNGIGLIKRFTNKGIGIKNMKSRTKN